MSQIAIISDIHGNLPALEAVLDDIDRRRIKTIYCLGDLVGKGPSPAEVIDLCWKRCTNIIKGNWDDIMVRSDKEDAVLRWHRARIGPKRLALLAQLPNCIQFELGSKQVRLFHASQVSIYHRIYPYSPLADLEAMFSNSDFTGYENPEPDWVGYGDIHAAYILPMYRLKKTIFNVGSVGNPLDENRAAYAILEDESSGMVVGSSSLQIIRLRYDIEKAIFQAQEAAMPELEYYKRELRTAIYRGRQTNFEEFSKNA